MSDELKLALKGFVPVSGSIEDIKIVQDLDKLNKKLVGVNLVQFRIQEKKGYAQMTSKMREIQTEEKSLIRRITSRNLDF